MIDRDPTYGVPFCSVRRSRLITEAGELQPSFPGMRVHPHNSRGDGRSLDVVTPSIRPPLLSC